MTTTDTVGRHRRTPATGHVPTDRTHANCRCGTGIYCPRHMPKTYAMFTAKHRSDR